MPAPYAPPSIVAAPARCPPFGARRRPVRVRGAPAPSPARAARVVEGSREGALCAEGAGRARGWTSRALDRGGAGSAVPAEGALVAGLVTSLLSRGGGGTRRGCVCAANAGLVAAPQDRAALRPPLPPPSLRGSGMKPPSLLVCCFPGDLSCPQYNERGGTALVLLMGCLGHRRCRRKTFQMNEP